MRADVAQVGMISPVLFSLYVNNIPVPSRHVGLALYADDTAVIATSRKPALLVSYLELYLADLKLWLRKWRIAVNVSKSMAMLFTRGQIQRPRPVALAKKASTKECVSTRFTSKQLLSQPTANPSTLEGISDHLDTLPMDACVKLTRRLLTAVPSLLTIPARSRAVLKIVILFVAEYGSTA
jgi:hypothetical protein